MTEIPIFWVAIAVVVIVWLFARRPRFRPRGRGKTHPRVDVEGDLLHACRGDRAMAERLIRHELDRKPELSRTGAALMALSRLRADKR